MKTLFLILFNSLLINAFAQNETVIGSQTWANQNLNVETFSNGDVIKQAKTAEEWVAFSKNKTPAWCYYNFDASNGDKVGKLYNWYAVNDQRDLAPEGWKIPTQQDWLQLKEYLGVSQNGRKLKSQQGWGSSISHNGSNEVGFNGYPAGMIEDSGEFKFGDTEAYRAACYWTKTTYAEDANSAHYHCLNANQFQVASWKGNKGCGFSVRCIK